MNRGELILLMVVGAIAFVFAYIYVLMPGEILRPACLFLAIGCAGTAIGLLLPSVDTVLAWLCRLFD